LKSTERSAVGKFAPLLRRVLDAIEIAQHALLGEIGRFQILFYSVQFSRKQQKRLFLQRLACVAADFSRTFANSRIVRALVGQRRQKTDRGMVDLLVALPLHDAKVSGAVQLAALDAALALQLVEPGDHEQRRVGVGREQERGELARLGEQAAGIVGDRPEQDEQEARVAADATRPPAAGPASRCSSRPGTRATPSSTPAGSTRASN
jgi:hypothetical protein